MPSNGYQSPTLDPSNLSMSFTREGLTTKLRQTLNAAGKRMQGTREKNVSIPDLKTLTLQNQELIMRTAQESKHEESTNIVRTLDESRNMLKSSLEEFKLEQIQYKKQLEQITRRREAATQRRQENTVPLSILKRHKSDNEGLTDLHSNLGMNTIYQAYFGALLISDQNLQQHPTDKAAVIKYIRRRERRTRAEKNRTKSDESDDVFEKQTADLIEKMDDMDMKVENERQRQNNIVRAKMQAKKTKSNNIAEANEIIDQAHEANLARQRVEQAHRDKLEARLSEARRQTPTNIIHIQSRLNHADDSSQLTDEQRAVTKNSIQLLNENNGDKAIRSTTPICVNEDSNEKLANINI